jgi:electron transport complex protein RnfE
VCASKQSLFVAATDAVGQSLGFGLALGSIAAIREILGTGALFELRVMPAAWPDWVIMVLPPGAFLTFGLLLGTVNWITAFRDGKKKA